MKKWKNYLSFVAFSLLFSVFIPCFISENTSALSDISGSFYTNSSDVYNGSISICNGDCNYHYLYISDFICPSGVDVNGTFNLQTNSSTQLAFIRFYTFSDLYGIGLFDISNNLTYSSLRFSNLTGLQQFSCSISYTLTDTNPFSSGITPTGNIDITQNGTFDVTQYAQATVNVSSSVGGDAPYTGILEGIKVSILTCGAIIVVLYFFYCFYRIIIRSTGGKQ